MYANGFKVTLGVISACVLCTVVLVVPPGALALYLTKD